MSHYEDFVARHFPSAKPDGKGHQARCPVPEHGKGRGDKQPSLSLGRGDSDCVLIHCFANCSTERVVAALGLTTSDLFPPSSTAAHSRAIGRSDLDDGYEKLVARARKSASRDLGDVEVRIRTFDYHTKAGVFAFRILRFDGANGDKTFRPAHRDNGKWRLGYPSGRRVLYRLCELPAEGPIFLVEGEKTADAGARIGLAITTSPGGSKGSGQAAWSVLAGRDVVILPDQDDAGSYYAVAVQKHLLALDPPARVSVVALPGLSECGDLFDYIEVERAKGKSSDEINADVLQLVEDQRGREADGEHLDSWGPYRISNGEMVYIRNTREGAVAERLTNFVARIVGDVTVEDGVEQERHIELAVTLKGREQLITVRGPKFQSMQWVCDELGSEAIVSAGFATKDRAREAIQVLSGRRRRIRRFRCTGWMQIENVGNAYLSATGAIGANGTHPEVETLLEGSSSDFALPPPIAGRELREAAKQVLELRLLAPDRISLSLLAAVARAPLGDVDMSVMLVGESGICKTELAALFQQFWGPDLDSRNLPASWLSTGNSLEMQAFVHKDALLVVDDFAPSGSQAEVQKLFAKAEQLLRGQGNAAGRNRLNSDLKLRHARRPRGLILSTGEALPPGHSLLARIQVIDVRAGDVDLDRLTVQQERACNGVHAQVLASYARYLAGNLEETRAAFAARRRELRQELMGTSGHLRSVDIVCQQLAAFEVFVRFLRDEAGIGAEEAEELLRAARSALLEVAEEQSDDVAAEAPLQRFLSLVRESLASGETHLAGYDGNLPDLDDPQAVGWRNQGGGFFGQGTRIGFIGEDGIYLLPEASVKSASRAAAQGAPFSMSTRKLGKALAAADLLVSSESGRNKNTMRRQLAGKRQLAFHIQATLLAEGAQWSQRPQARARGAAGRDSRDQSRDRREQPTVVGAPVRSPKGEVSGRRERLVEEDGTKGTNGTLASGDCGSGAGVRSEPPASKEERA